MRGQRWGGSGGSDEGAMTRFMLCESDVVRISDDGPQAVGKSLLQCAGAFLLPTFILLLRFLRGSGIADKYRRCQDAMLSTIDRYAFRPYSDLFQKETWTDFIDQIYYRMSRGELNSVVPISTLIKLLEDLNFIGH